VQRPPQPQPRLLAERRSELIAQWPVDIEMGGQACSTAQREPSLKEQRVPAALQCRSWSFTARDFIFTALGFPVNATLSTPSTASSTATSTLGSSTGSSALLQAFVPSILRPAKRAS
jgi:hypothetical protein